MHRSIYKKDNVPSSRLQSSFGPEDVDEEDDETDGLGDLPAPTSAAPSSSSSSMPPPSLLGRRAGKSQRQEYSPLTSEDCFQEALQVDVDGQGTWRVYITPPKSVSKKTRVCNHSSVGTDPALASMTLDVPEEDELPEDAGDQSPGTMILFHHGAGFSALSFALAAKEITAQTNGSIGVMSFDCRGHGRTVHPDGQDLNMSLDRLTQDAIGVLERLYPSGQWPTLFLAGHSMGGSVVVSLGKALEARGDVTVGGVIVMDVVEGTALEALEGMKGIITAQPKGFYSIEEAIQWHVDSGIIHNAESARRSVGALLIKNDAYQGGNKVQATTADEPVEVLQDSSDQAGTSTQDLSSYPYIWRANLLSTSAYWPEWFTSLSSRFLSLRCAKQLLLAGTDRLDKELMIGQMQGKYQLIVWNDVGHNLMQDAPQRTATLLIEFCKRNARDRDFLKGVKKVGQA
ncbi:unnamed protein product [Sympodiomycopsis kandeliae]